MANKSVRIRTTPGGNDKYVSLKLENDLDFFEILSLKISQKDVYGSFNSDYGVVVGRVIANGGIGIPNAKLSVFIPITEEDKMNAEISALYPYTSPRDKNVNNVRYNLLPRVSTNNPFIIEGSFSPTVPVGTFPTKEEITTNETYLEVYEKYFKYTTVTNQSGDYMFFGIPVGVQTIHMSVDVTDIGQFSMTPATMISQLGYSPELFDGNRVRYSTDLDTIPNIDTQNVSVDVRPFWGDADNFEIGITRQDFKIRANLVSSVTVFGAGFTDNFGASWGSTSYFGDRDDSSSAMGRNIGYETENGGAGPNPQKSDGVKYNVGMASRRNGQFSIEVYTIPNRISSEDVEAGNFDTQNDITILGNTQYSTIQEDGLFLLTLPCNRKKKTVNEFGQFIDTTDDDPNGIFTEFYGMFIIDYAPELTIYNDPANKARSERERTDRVRIKIPQSAPMTVVTTSDNNFKYQTFTSERAGTIAGQTVAERQALNETWRKQVFKFTGGTLYSVAKFHGAVYEDSNGNQASFSTTNFGGSAANRTKNIWRNAGALSLLNQADIDTGLLTNVNAPFTSEGDLSPGIASVPTFVGEWLNMSIYFPQIYNYTGGNFDVSRAMTSDNGGFTDMTVTNTYRVVGFRKDTSYFLRSDLHPTTFVEVPPSDLVKIINSSFVNDKGLVESYFSFSDPLTGQYPKIGNEWFIYRGLGDADVIQFLIDNGIISA